MKKSVLILFLFGTLGVKAQEVDSLNLVLGKVNYSKESIFSQLPESLASRAGMYIRTEAKDAFVQMKEAAKKDGVRLRIISAARNFSHQKRIWEAKWNGSRQVGGKNLRQVIPNEKARAIEILKYSSMPGTSRHHWGTDIDINSLSPSYFESGKGKKEYEWLRDNAHEFGFCQVYSEKGKDRSSGYEEEKWHWSYMPIASEFLSFYLSHVKADDLHGFEGSSALPFEQKLKFIKGISSDCK